MRAGKSTSNLGSFGRGEFWIPVLVAVVASWTADWLHSARIAGLNDDGASFCVVASGMSDGLFPYRDVFSKHAPVHLWLMGVSWSCAGRQGVVGFGLGVVALLTFVSIRLTRQLGFPGRGFLWREIAASLAVWACGAGWSGFGVFLPAGLRPQSTATLFLLLAVAGFHRRRLFGAGACLALAIGSWQPALGIAVGLAGGGIVAEVRSWRAVGRLLLGGAVVGIALALGLAIQGAAAGAWSQAVRFPFFSSRLGLIEINDPWGLFIDSLSWPYFAVGLVGLGWLVGSSVPVLGIFGKRRSNPRNLAVRGALLGWVLSYSVVLGFQFHGRGDLMPLVLPLAIGVGLVFWDLQRLGRAMDLFSIAGSLGLAIWLLSTAQAPYRADEIQKEKCRPFVDMAGDDGVLVLADPVLQLGVFQPPVHPYVYWEPGTEEWIEEVEDGGLEGFLDRLLRREYGVIVVGKRAFRMAPRLAARLAEAYTERHPLFRQGRWIWVRKANLAAFRESSG